MTNRGFAGLAAAALGVCCGLPLLLAAGSGVTVAGLGLRSWALVLAGALIAGVGAWRWHDRGAQ